MRECEVFLKATTADGTLEQNLYPLFFETTKEWSTLKVTTYLTEQYSLAKLTLKNYHAKSHHTTDPMISSDPLKSWRQC